MNLTALISHGFEQWDAQVQSITLSAVRNRKALMFSEIGRKLTSRYAFIHEIHFVFRVLSSAAMV